MGIDLDEFAKKYFNVTREEMEMAYIRQRDDNDIFFENSIRSKHNDREDEKKDGKPSLLPQPLAQIISITVKPKNQEQQLALYGNIYADFGDAFYHHIYSRKLEEDPDIIGTEGSLTLNGPDYSCNGSKDYGCLPLFGSRICLKLFDQTNGLFADEYFTLDDHIDDNYYYVQVKSMVVDCQQMYLTLQYLAIPFGVYCRLGVGISYKKGVEQRKIVNVNGKIVARIGDTYEDSSSQELVLFNKEDTEFERVENGNLKISRSWVSLPAYAPLVIEVMDLSEFGGRKIGNGIIKLLPQQGLMTSGSLLLDDMFLTVGASWFSPQPMGRNDDMCSTSLPQIPTKMVEEMETDAPTKVNKKRKKVDSDGKDESADDDDGESPSDESKGGFLEHESSDHHDDVSQKIEEMDIDREDKSVAPSPCVESGDVLASSRYPSWHLVSRKNKPQSSPAVEIFSVFIGKEKSKAGQIHGAIKVKCDANKFCYIFKRDENDVSRLSEDFEVIPVSDGSRSFDRCEGLKINFDLKGVNGLTIKGYVDWAARNFNGSSWYGKQLCSLVQGHGGFAAVHYSVFSKAVSVILKVSLQFETGSFDEVWGSVVSQYSSYEYSSPYNKDFYRTVLFNMTQGDQIQITNNAQIPLSRSMLVVPSSSSLILDVNLQFGSYQELVRTIIIEIGEESMIIKRKDYCLHLKLEWSEIK